MSFGEYCIISVGYITKEGARSNTYVEDNAKQVSKMLYKVL